MTGEVSQKEVTAVFVRESDHINYLTIIDENDNVQVLETTDGHPFWVVTDEPDLERAARSVVDENGAILYHHNIAPGLNGFWVEAKDLREGDVFLGANGELSVLVSAERIQFEETIKVYNFTVDGNSNYFVIAKDDPFGQTCILVHNATYGKDSGLTYKTNTQHPKEGTNSTYKKDLKTPEPPNAAEVFQKAVQDPTNLKAWYAIFDKKTIYRFFASGDGTVHFSGYVEGAKAIIKQMKNKILKW